MNTIPQPISLIGGTIPISAIICFVVLFFVMSALLMWLWNITITPLFGIRKISFWESVRLLIIAGILFGKFGFNFNL